MSIEIGFFQNAILDWFEQHGRVYPWRIEIDPFKILLAEIMLQRTRADQVLNVYENFIKKYPSPSILAESKLDDIEFFLSKLGLRWRSKMVKKMAQHLLSFYDGEVPDNRENLLTLPGVGNYIADAVEVFAFNQRKTVIDSNVVRVVSRFFGIPNVGEMRNNKNFILFCQKLSANLREDEIKNFNWAILDFGALICKPSPKCNLCANVSKCNYFKYKLVNKEVI